MEKIEVTDEMRKGIYLILKSHPLDSEYIMPDDLFLDEIANLVIKEVEAAFSFSPSAGKAINGDSLLSKI